MGNSNYKMFLELKFGILPFCWVSSLQSCKAKVDFKTLLLLPSWGHHSFDPISTIREVSIAWGPENFRPLFGLIKRCEIQQFLQPLSVRISQVEYWNGVGCMQCCPTIPFASLESLLLSLSHSQRFVNSCLKSCNCACCWENWDLVAKVGGCPEGDHNRKRWFDMFSWVSWGVLVCVHACVGVSGWPSFLYHIAKSNYLGLVWSVVWH